MHEELKEEGNTSQELGGKKKRSDNKNNENLVYTS